MENDYLSEIYIEKAKEKDLELFKNLKHENQFKHIQKMNTKNKSKIEILEEGLNTPLNESFKGYKLLQKMGFKSGELIGKNSHGLSEPIKINLNSNRNGIGIKIKKPKKMDPSKHELNTLESQKISKYKVDSKMKYMFTKMKNMFKDAILTCRSLDIKNKIFNNEIVIDSFNLLNLIETENKGLISKAVEWSIQGTDSINEYCRQTFNYCIYCSIHFKSRKELFDSCKDSTYKYHEENVCFED